MNHTDKYKNFESELSDDLDGLTTENAIEKLDSEKETLKQQLEKQKQELAVKLKKQSQEIKSGKKYHKVKNVNIFYYLKKFFRF